MIDVDLNRVSVPLEWTDLFGRDAPTHVEIGSGKGRFLLEMATQHPEYNLLAVERAGKYHQLSCQRAARRGLTNVRIVRTTAEDLLFRLLTPASVATIYVLFPDPWPKKRHHKRRVFKADVVRAMSKALEVDGRLLVKTDDPAYAESIHDLLVHEAGFELLDSDAAFEELPLTGFEHKYLDQGRSILSFACARVD